MNVWESLRRYFESQDHIKGLQGLTLVAGLQKIIAKAMHHAFVETKMTDFVCYSYLLHTDIYCIDVWCSVL